MEALGYTENLNDKNANDVNNITNSMFSEELKNRANKAKNSYPEFLKALQDKALGLPSQPHSSPLTSLCALSYYYITYPLYDVQPTSPVTPSLAGYSGLGALAGGAYGFNLGGIGTLMSAILA